MPRVKAIANFVNDEHLQGDVFDIADEAEAKRLIDVQAVVLVHEATPLTTPVEQPAPAPAAQQPAPVAPVAPTPEQISHDVAQVEEGNTQV